MEIKVLNESLWEAETNAWETIRDPALAFKFQERITRDMLELAANLPKEKAVEEIEKIRRIVSDHPLKTGYFTGNFLPAVRRNITAAASTITHRLRGEYDMSEDPVELLKTARSSLERGDVEGTLDMVGRAGVLLLEGKTVDTELEQQMEKTAMWDYILGAKNVRFVALTNNIRLP